MTQTNRKKSGALRTGISRVFGYIKIGEIFIGFFIDLAY